MFNPIDSALRPITRSWGRGVFRSLGGVPQPRDDRRTHASGIEADRILLFGSGMAVGWGVLSHDMALGGSLARALSGLTARGADVDVVADAELVASHAVRALRSVDLSGYDAIVVTLGSNEAVALSSASAWRRSLEELLDYITETASPGVPVFLVGIHSITQITRWDAMVAPAITHNRNLLNRTSAGLSARRAGVTFVPFDPAPRVDRNRYRSLTEYRNAGAFLARHVAPALAGGGSGRVTRRARTGPVDAHARHQAIDELDILARGAEQRFDRLTEFARRSFRASAARMILVDDDRFWTKSSQGEFVGGGSFEDVICMRAIEQEDSVVIADAAADPAFASTTHLTGVPPIRFYAAHRVEAPNGVPVGVLCVEDADARDPAVVDRSLLRDIALLVQKELWLGSTAAAAAGFSVDRFPQQSTAERNFAPAGRHQPPRSARTIGPAAAAQHGGRP